MITDPSSLSSFRLNPGEGFCQACFANKQTKKNKTGKSIILFWKNNLIWVIERNKLYSRNP